MRSPAADRLRRIAPVAALTALLLLYVWFVGERALAMLGSGEPVLLAIGAAILVIPLLTVWFVIREVTQAVAVDRLRGRLAAEGGLDVDDLPRSPAGRIDRAVARERFDAVRLEADARPQDWRSWFRLGWAYDAAGDRRRAREALRRAVVLERAEGR